MLSLLLTLKKILDGGEGKGTKIVLPASKVFSFVVLFSSKVSHHYFLIVICDHLS